MTTGFLLNGIDADQTYITKDYLLDQYPNLMENMKTPQLWGWGDDSYGQLGTNNTSSYSSPVTTVAGGTNWKQVSNSIRTGWSAAIKTDGTLWVWGVNSSGQLGTNNITNYSSPVTTIAGGTNWKSVSCGYIHSAAIKTDGTLWVWGTNNFGQLGTNNITNYSSPVTTIAGGTNWKSVSCGRYHTAAIKTDGTLWVWGYNLNGQLGTSSNTSSPVTTVAGGTNWKSVSCGYMHSAAIKTDGTLWTWGSNNKGQLGTNNISSYSSPVTTVAGGTNWKSVSCGANFTAAIKSDGTLWVCGYNIFGQLGTNNLSNYSSPVTTVAGGTNWKSVSAGFFHTAAIKTDGTLWVCGYNNKGQLGTNNTAPYYSPVTTVVGGTNWKSVSVGFYNTAAISESEGW